MSTSAGNSGPASAGGVSGTPPKPESTDTTKGKGKNQDDVDDDENGQEEDEDDEDDDDDGTDSDEEDDEEEDYQEIDPNLITSRRTRGIKVDYATKEALAKAGLTPSDLEEDDEMQE